MATMYDRIRERSDLAHTYAQDGAYTRAAQILTELAQEVTRHAEGIARAEAGRRTRLAEGAEQAKAALAANAAKGPAQCTCLKPRPGAFGVCVACGGETESRKAKRPPKLSQGQRDYLSGN
jgi:hypothetical protein